MIKIKNWPFSLWSIILTLPITVNNKILYPSKYIIILSYYTWSGHNRNSFYFLVVQVEAKLQPLSVSRVDALEEFGKYKVWICLDSTQVSVFCFYFSLFFYRVSLIWVSLCSPAWSWIHYVYSLCWPQIHGHSPVSASKVLGLQVCNPTPNYILFFCGAGGLT